MFCIHIAGDAERHDPTTLAILAQCVYRPNEEDRLLSAARIYDDSRRELLVGVHNGRPVAILGYSVGERGIEIMHLAVDRSHRGRNYGRRMVRYLRKHEPDARIMAETDGDAVGFYRACGFDVASLGEKYPGVERFHCSIDAQHVNRAGNDVVYDALDNDEIHRIAPLWNQLNAHHCRVTEGWSDHFAQFTFDARVKLLCSGHKTIRIDVARLAGEEELLGYAISSVDAEGRGELESIYVEERHRGRSVGDSLARRSIRWMEDNGARDISIVVAAGNDEALPFYERLGFIPRTYRLKRPSSTLASTTAVASPDA